MTAIAPAIGSGARPHPIGRAGDVEVRMASRFGWLRASVLGANDGIVSTASLIIGVAAAAVRPADVLIAGTAGLVAGALSMAAGEYVSVSAQADTERSELARERRELLDDPEGELAELAAIYVQRGIDPATAVEVATQLMATDALGAHARDELELSSSGRARPVQAAAASAASFTVGAAMPLAAALLAPADSIITVVGGGSLLFLALLGGLAAYAGRAALWRGMIRVTGWGAFAMTATAAIGWLIGVAV